MDEERPSRFLFDTVEEALIASVRIFMRSQSSGDQGKLIAFFHLLEQQAAAEVDLEMGSDDTLTLTLKAKSIVES